MFALRFAAYLLAFASFIILIADGAQSIAAGEFVWTPLAALVGSSQGADAAIITVSTRGGELLPGLLELVVGTVLAQSASALVLALAVGLVMIDGAMNVSLSRFRRSLKRL